MAFEAGGVLGFCHGKRLNMYGTAVNLMTPSDLIHTLSILRRRSFSVRQPPDGHNDPRFGSIRYAFQLRQSYHRASPRSDLHCG